MDQLTIDFMRQLNDLQTKFDGLIKPEIPLAAGIRPLFSAYLSAAVNDVTGDGTVYTIVFDTEIFDRNSDFDIATGIFTAPVDGYYLLIAGCYMDEIDVAHNDVDFRIVTSNRSYRLLRGHPYNMARIGDDLQINGSAIADMDAADTATVSIDVDGGAKVVDILQSSLNTFFHGYLLI